MGQRLRIAFVDDELNVLNSLRRSMRTMLDEWEMAFFAKGADLLAHMERETFDIVVSDIRMPEMDGATLLGEVSRRHPDTVRVILSGYADREAVFQTLGPAHIYLAKPCDCAALRQALRSRAILRERMTSGEMRRLLGGTSSLPSAPATFLELVEQLRSPRSSVAAVADIVGRDAAMTAELLKLTNSSYFAVNARVTTPLQAVRLLGLDLVQTLALQIGIFRQFQGSAESQRWVEVLNGYGFALGSLAENLALADGVPGEGAKAAQCAALLANIGGLILLDKRGEEYRALLASVPEDSPLSLAEEKRFGADRGLLGAYLLSLWGFSEAIVEAVAYAAWPSRCPNRDNPILRAVHLAMADGPPFPLLAHPAPPVEKDQTYLAAGPRTDIQGRTDPWLTES